MKKIADILFSPAIRATQAELGVRDYITGLELRDHWKAELSTEQMDFIRGRDSFYLGTASKDGSPYIQHRGGTAGFIQVENATALWFPDYSGNRQYISVGNLSENKQAFIFLMDYENRRRLKLWGRAHVLDHKNIPFVDGVLSESATIERIIRFEIDALDENCRRHIQPRYSVSECLKQISRAEQEIGELKRQIRVLKAGQEG